MSKQKVTEIFSGFITLEGGRIAAHLELDQDLKFTGRVLLDIENDKDRTFVLNRILPLLRGKKITFIYEKKGSK